uniref:Peroxin-13 n=1 Tax=Syphacia muris TaxID=451379 RepID=A0A0N5AEL3_9BILA
MGDIPKTNPPVPPRNYYVENSQKNYIRSGGDIFNFRTSDLKGTNDTVGNVWALCNSAKFVEQSFRGAFQNFEAFANALISVANMLTSMQNAAYSTVAALVGIADQYKLLKSQLHSLVCSLPFLRWIRFIWQKFAQYMHMKSGTTTEESVWNDALPILDRTDSDTFSSANVIFWIFLIIGPYLIYKSLRSFSNSFENTKKWAFGEGSHYRAEALFDFQSQYSQELSFQAGDCFCIAPKEQQPAIKGWILGSAVKDGRIGLIPINYIQLVKSSI